MTLATEYQKEVRTLRQRIDHLEAEVCYLKSRLKRSGGNGRLIDCGFTKSEADMLRALATGRVHSRDALREVAGIDPETDSRTIDGHIKRIRRKAPKIIPGFEITALYGEGYLVKGESLDVLREFIAERHDG